jgi:hypothetical protein
VYSCVQVIGCHFADTFINVSGHPGGLVVSVVFERSRVRSRPLSLVTKECQYNDNQSPEAGSRVNSRNVAFCKYTSDNGQCPTVPKCGGLCDVTKESCGGGNDF